MLKENHGLMSRFKATLGVRVSEPHCANGYLLERHIRKALIEYTKTRTHKESKRIDRLINKLDRLNNCELVYLHYLLTEQSLVTMVSALSGSFARLKKESSTHYALVYAEQNE